MIADIALVISLASLGLSGAALWRARQTLRPGDVKFAPHAFDIVSPGFKGPGPGGGDHAIPTLSIAENSLTSWAESLRRSSPSRRDEDAA